MVVESDTPQLPEGRMLSPAELAARWGVSTRLLQKWRTNGDGPAYRHFGSLVRYPYAAILAHEGVGEAA